MDSNKILWEDLDLLFIQRIDELKLNCYWKFICQTMIANFLYTIRRTVKDAVKDKQNQEEHKGEDITKV